MANGAMAHFSYTREAKAPMPPYNPCLDLGVNGISIRLQKAAMSPFHAPRFVKELEPELGR